MRSLDVGIAIVPEVERSHANKLSNLLEELSRFPTQGATGWDLGSKAEESERDPRQEACGHAGSFSCANKVDAPKGHGNSSMW